jgi:hypothetical protein
MGRGSNRGIFPIAVRWAASMCSLERSDIFLGAVTGILAFAALLVIFGF